MKWIWILVGAAAGFALGYYWTTLVTLYRHRDQLGAAGDVLSGAEQAWGGLEALWNSRSS